MSGFSGSQGIQKVIYDSQGKPINPELKQADFVKGRFAENIYGGTGNCGQ
jgi:DNA-binding protein